MGFVPHNFHLNAHYIAIYKELMVSEEFPLLVRINVLTRNLISGVPGSNVFKMDESTEFEVERKNISCACAW